MANRREFPRAVRIDVIKRATRDSVIYCEKCHAPAKRFQIDHVIADSHGGNPVIENAELICEVCFAVKNPIDTTIAAKLKRQEADHIRATRPAGTIKSAGFKVGAKPRREREPLAPRRLYEAIP
jgi:5-methylcytosine-specific restriction protein A